ncbi:hypothetical protein K32_23990 [Kaistia sp. 32K]|nr:hypothetical protein K32_23990 [Kaistia sp. 32K]
MASPAFAQDDPMEQMKYAAIIMREASRVFPFELKGKLTVTSPTTATVQAHQIIFNAVPDQPCVYQERLFEEGEILQFDFNQLTADYRLGLQGWPLAIPGNRFICISRGSADELADPNYAPSGRNCLSILRYNPMDARTFLDAVVFFQTYYCPAAIPKPY